METLSWIQWISLVEIPAITASAWYIIRSRREAQNAVACLSRSLNAFKLEVAKDYVSVQHLAEVEGRIMRYLTRIEDKLDQTLKSHGHD